jgi:hypothetical protein
MDSDYPLVSSNSSYARRGWRSLEQHLKKTHLDNLKIRKKNQSLWKILFSFYI